ncbi:hypothetical protein FUAX_12540 [Fulvitalea axinellae]|uniref:Glycosyltransferase 2-like domain-containing protein n=1 Tax=Fulvitalea axinellae TaxID=1182444 RepID=A0AAU9CPH2_9BACT|nr:hypothetical protein FUAX_12540 [Fulvitalea axinellae]
MTDKKKRNIYLERYAWPEFLSEDMPIDSDTELSVVIPCHNEPDLISSLRSLANCDDPGCGTEVIVIINQGTGCAPEIDRQNEKTYQEALHWAEKTALPFRLIVKWVKDLPKKHAGVGLARKIGMDEAVRRFESIGKDGVIICFDADSLCEKNYLTEIRSFFKQHPHMPGCSIHFEHPLEGPLAPEIYDGIATYELHLRYYVDALRWAGHPFAYQTIGSSMASRSSVYQKQGGMNRRKAGEDFYFLQKIIELGNFEDLTTTKVIPSPRASDRVPFGTGRAISEWLEEKKEIDLTYHPDAFVDLKELFASPKKLYVSKDAKNVYEGLPESIRRFISLQEFNVKIESLLAESRKEETFRKKFFHWFNAFTTLKFVHFYRDEVKPNVNVKEACLWLFGKYGMEPQGKDTIEILKQIRAIDSKKITTSIS